MKPRVRCRKDATLEDRLRLHMIEAPSGCWIWTGALNEFGYGRIQIDGRTGYAHRVSHEVFTGPIPDGHQIDHLCRRPRCINPRHLQAVTPRTNVLRGTSPGARAQRRESCTRGHAYAEHSRQYGGRRFCQTCISAHHRRYTLERRAAREAERAAVMADLVAVRDGQVSR